MSHNSISKARAATLAALDKKIFTPLAQKIERSIEHNIAAGASNTSISHFLDGPLVTLKDFHNSPLFRQTRVKYLAEKGVKIEIIHLISRHVFIRIS